MPDDPERSMVERLIRIEVLLEKELGSIVRRLDDHEVRIRAAERWRYAVPMALIVALISGATALITAVGR